MFDQTPPGLDFLRKTRVLHPADFREGEKFLRQQQSASGAPFVDEKPYGHFTLVDDVKRVNDIVETETDGGEQQVFPAQAALKMRPASRQEFAALRSPLSVDRPEVFKEKVSEGASQLLKGDNTPPLSREAKKCGCESKFVRRHIPSEQDDRTKIGLGRGLQRGKGRHATGV
ncbi:hypothetical protein GCM10022631_24960 [Deinococcus rubellus]